MSTVESPPLPRVGLESAGWLMTPEEFDAITDYDEEYSYELIHGVLVVSPFASEAERSPNELLGHWLLNYAEQHPEGKRLVATLFEQYVRTHDSRRRADRVIWAVVEGRQPDPRRDPPTIVVEFVSKGKAAWRRDYLEKRDEYLELGIREYWVIDRFQRALTVYSQRDRKPVEQTIPENAVYRTELLPGFELPLQRLLEAADRWSEAV